MSLWFVFALMTAAAIFAVLWPLGRRSAAEGGSDLEVYRDQLEEIARDRAEGRIGAAEADAARIEVSRRLIAAADAAESEAQRSEGGPVWRRRVAAIVGLVLLPIGASVAYLALGSPQLPGQPLAERRAAAQQDNSIDTLIARVEAHLEKNPNDARGYEVVAPVYLRMGRFADAVNARRKAIALAGENAQRQADLGEALAALGNGVITADAKAAFERALELDRNDLKSLYFIGLAAEQDGDRKKAAAIWMSMLKDAPADAPWAPMVGEALTRVGGVPPKLAEVAPAQPGPSADDIAAAGQMSEQDRSEMVRGMVARLADRLSQDSGDVAGWQRLMRAYMVMGDRDKAKGAAGDARKALAADPDKLRQIDETIKSMGLDG